MREKENENRQKDKREELPRGDGPLEGEASL